MASQSYPPLAQSMQRCWLNACCMMCWRNGATWWAGKIKTWGSNGLHGFQWVFSDLLSWCIFKEHQREYQARKRGIGSWPALLPQRSFHSCLQTAPILTPSPPWSSPEGEVLLLPYLLMRKWCAPGASNDLHWWLWSTQQWCGFCVAGTWLNANGSPELSGEGHDRIGLGASPPCIAPEVYECQQRFSLATALLGYPLFAYSLHHV